MHLTDYHAMYFAHELTKRCPSDSAEKLAGALVDARGDPVGAAVGMDHSGSIMVTHAEADAR